MNRRLIQFFTFALMLAVGFMSCQKDKDPIEQKLTKDYSNEVAHEWMDFYTDIERYTPGYRPPVSARTAAYISLAAYEAAVQGMPEYNSLTSHYSGLSVPVAEKGLEYHWPTCVHAAYAKSFEAFFPTAPADKLDKLYNLEKKYNDKFSAEVPQAVYNRSKAFGEVIAETVFVWSRTDGAGHEAYLHNNDPGYNPPVGVGLWQPTYPDYSPALLPHWGQVRTFAASDDDKVVAPLAYSEDPNSELYNQARETMLKVSKIKAGNPDYPEDEWIADFWSDDCPTKTLTPAARWVAITNQLVEAENVTLDFAVYAYAKVSMALCDAGIRCWGEKYFYNYIRPIDYIRQVMGQPDWNTIMCPADGNFYTPNFPTYPSGHATFGAASAEVLSDLFGYSYSMTDRCHEGRIEFLSTPRSFGSFDEMADENAYSRIPLGVHFRMDAEAGVDLGHKVGKKVNSLPWKE
jgi:hypothetical protein